MVAAMGLGEFGFLVAADGADDGRTQRLGPLARDEADPAGRGMEQDGVAFLDLVGLPDQVLGRHALEHHRGRLLIGDAVRQHDQAIRRHDPHLRIGALGAARIGNAITDLYVSDARTDRLDHAGRLCTKAAWQGGRIRARAHIGVDIVEADGRVPDTGFSRPWLADVDLLPDENLGPSGLMEANCVGHDAVPFGASSRLHLRGRLKVCKGSGTAFKRDRVKVGLRPECGTSANVCPVPKAAIYSIHVPAGCLLDRTHRIASFETGRELSRPCQRPW